MKRIVFISFFFIILCLTSILCGISGGSLTSAADSQASAQSEQATEETLAATAQAPTYTVNSKEPLTLEEGEAVIITLTESEEEALIEWTSSDESVVTIDSGGRADATGIGSAAVTAELADNQKVECEVTVTEAEDSEYDGFSTCIIANTDILEENIENVGSANLYYIMVNRQENCVTVYTYDENGEYTVPVRAMVCSCGKNNGTITGNYGIYFKNEWNSLLNNVYGHYVSGISGDYLFHSVPYYYAEADTLEVEEFNKLGEAASLGCVRMETADVKWIFDNCPVNTGITIYDDDDPGPLGKPDAIRITDTSCGWDPTDDNESNPYNDKAPEISGAADCTLSVGDSFYPLTGVSAVDTCSNDITDEIEVIGNVVTSRAGTYKVSYYVEDAMHRSDEVEITVTVE